MMNGPTKTLSVDLFGHVQVPVTGTLVIEVPVDATEGEIHELAEELADLVQDWEDADGNPEDADDVTGTGDMEVHEIGREAEFTFIRNAEGKLVLRRGDS